MTSPLATSRRGLRTAAAGALIALSALALPSAGQSARVTRQVLSHPGFVSTWAYLESATNAYASPSTHAGGGDIGIHGTDEPSLIPGHPSHGCIRVPNWEIIKLARLLPIGTPLTIE